MKLSLRNKMIAVNMVTLILTFIVIFTFVTGNLSATNKKMLIDTLDSKAQVSVYTIKQTILTGQNTEATVNEFRKRSKDFSSKISRDIGTRVLVFSKSKELLADSSDEKWDHANFPELDEVLKGNRTYVIRSVNGVRHMYFGVPVVIPGQVIGEILLVQPMKEIDESTRNSQTLLLLSFITSTLIIAVVITLLTIKITKPIKKLQESAVKIAAGNYSGRIDIKSSDEIGELSKSFNKMSHEIENKINTINIERNKLTSVLESMGEGVLALGIGGEFLAINNKSRSILGLSPLALSPLKLFPSALSGLELDSWLAEHAVDFKEASQKNFFIHLIKELEDLFHRVTEQKTRIVVEIHYDERNLLVCATPLMLDESAEGVVYIMNDVTELRLLQEKQKQFVTNVSHELKTPLTTILGYIDLLKTKGSDEKIFATSVHYLEDASERLLRLINDLIDLSSLSKFEFEVEPRSTDIASLVRDITGQMSLKAHKFNIKFLTEIEEAGDILADPERIKQALVNILDNAIKHSPEGEILVKLSPYKNGIELDIKDNGCGIPEEVLDKIFEPFYRVDKARSRALGGNGLGLSITREIIEKHNGKITIKSKEGQGTRVSIYLPR
ncbi:MAG: cell wall metabolism sensor histidine kinase WalK [Clostridia bacterium]|nr:cell wall metabolism sensor histidine kinase WalK [Clostridia bacterium]